MRDIQAIGHVRLRDSRFVGVICAVTAAALCGFAAPRAHGQEAVSLSPKFEKGRSVYIEQSTSTIRSMQRDAGAAPQTTKSESLYTMKATVLDVEAQGAARVRFVVDRVRWSDDTFANPAIDTQANLGDSPVGAAAVAKALLGKTVDMRMTPDRCEPDREQIAALQVALSQAIGSDARMMFLLDEFSLERFRYSWGEARLALFANKSVKPLDSWERALRQTMPDGNETQYNYKCKLGAVETREGRKVATLQFSGDIRQNESSVLKSSADRDVQMNLKSGTFSGSAIFDIERGEFTNQDTAAKLEVEVKARDARGEIREMRLRQVIESNTTIRPANEANAR